MYFYYFNHTVNLIFFFCIEVEGQRPKQRIIFSKSLNLHINWFIYSNYSKILILSTNSFGDFQPLHIVPGNIIKLTKLEGILLNKWS